jgi:hypothetical protein
MTNSRVSTLWATLLVLAACNEPKTFVPTKTEVFKIQSVDSYTQASQLLQADYVFVLDYSYSMFQARRDSVLVEMRDFASYLRQENIDYRIGIINGNTHAGSISTIASQFRAAFLTNSSLPTLESQVLAQIQNLGTPLSENTNFLLEAAARTLDTQGASFLRPAAQLVVAYVANSDDESATRINANRTPAYYANKMQALKSNSAYVSARSFVTLNTTECPALFYEQAGTRIAQTATLMDSAATQAGCVNSPTSEVFEDLARNVSRPVNRFTLIARPIAGTLQVFVDGSLNTSYTYNAASNEIVFPVGSEPAFDAAVRIEYEMPVLLSRTPKVSTLQVSVNGASVPQSDSNGWTYIESEKRIAFNGSAKPAHGSEVRVVYQLQ